MSRNENASTIQMMKLYQDNVKQDITTQTNVIKLVEEKLKDCTISLASLKQVASDLNVDYKNLETKMNNLGYALKEVSSRPSSKSISRASSVSSISDYSSSNTNSSSGYYDSEFSECEDLESTYVLVKTNPDGTLTDEELDELKWKLKRSSLCTTDEISSSSSGNSSDSEYDENNDLRDRDNKLLNQSCNELIKMLLKNSQ